MWLPTNNVYIFRILMDFMILFSQIVSVLLVVISLLVAVRTGVNDRANGKKYWDYAKEQHGTVVASGIAMFASPAFVGLFLSLALLFVTPESREGHSEVILVMVVLNWIGTVIVGYITTGRVKWFRSEQGNS